MKTNFKSLVLPGYPLTRDEFIQHLKEGWNSPSRPLKEVIREWEERKEIQLSKLSYRKEQKFKLKKSSIT
ncbi:MAG: hypothetical protein SFU20_11470 [Chitinophagaceae bacterium]|nr:hypothetical protein [Chitinophagaceae bacterium]